MRLDLVAAWALSVSCATSAVVADTPSIDVADTQHSAGADTLSLPFTFEHTRATPTDEHLETPEDSRIEFAVPLQGNEYVSALSDARPNAKRVLSRHQLS